MASIKDFLSYEYSGEVTEYKVTDEGKKWGGRRASQDYPYAVVRDVQAVTRLATTVCEEWERNLEKPKIYNTNPKFDPNVRVMQGWTNSLPNTKRLFVNGFVGGYMDALKIL